MYTPTILNLVIIYLLAYENGTECSETSAYKIQTPGSYPEENIQNTDTQHSQQTNIHALGGIRTHDLSGRAAADLRNLI
jgi:hypothetical protein